MPLTDPTTLLNFGADPVASVCLVSASNPQTTTSFIARVLVGEGGVTLIDNGPGKTLVISGSGGTLPGLTGSGGTAVSLNSNLYTISSSLPPVTNIIGVGAVSVSFVGSVFTVSGSGGGGGGGGSGDPFAAYVVTALTGALPNASLLTSSAGINVAGGTVSLNIFGQGGITLSTGSQGDIVISSSLGPFSSLAGQGGSVVTQVGGAWTVSSSNSPVQQIVGAGGTNVSSTGETFTISSSLGPVANITGAGATTVTVSGGVFTVSSSNYVQNILGQGGVTVTNAGEVFTVSSSLGPVQNIAGSGATTVTQAAGTWTVSSSNYVSSIVGTGGTSVTNSGEIFTVSSSNPPVTNIVAGNTNITVSAVGSVFAISASGGGTTPSFKLVTSNYAVLGTDQMLGMATSNFGLTATLPAPSILAAPLYFKDVNNNASTNPFYIKPHGSELIDSSSIGLTWQVNGGCVALFSDGVNWFSTN